MVKIKTTGSYANLSRSGRPNSLNEREIRSLKKAVIENPSIDSNQLASNLEIDIGKIVTPRTIRNYLKKANLSSFRTSKKQLLTVAMKKKRLEWALQHRDKPIEFWRSVLFSDESYINLFCGQPVYVRRRRGSALLPKFVNQKPKFPVKVMFWGCFAWGKVGSIKVMTESMNTERYIGVLKSKMVSSAKRIFGNEPFTYQDDSAPCHRSKKTMQWHEKNGTNLLKWPGNSPDMNPIENLWAILKQKI